MICYQTATPKLIRPSLTTPNQDSAALIKSKQAPGKVTEIIMRDDELSNMPMLMPLLAQLSQDDRWFVWVAPPIVLPKALLADAGIDLSKVILLKPDDNHSVYELSCQALKAGTCHAVITWPGYLSEDELNGLEDAARAGSSHGIVIRGRQNA